MEGQYNQALVDKFYPGTLMFEAMRIWSLPDNKKDKLQEMCGNGEYFGQIKKDGNWYQYIKSAYNVPYLFSRNESVKTGLLTEKIANVPHIQETLNILPPNTVIIGEIYYPGLTSNEVRTIMGCDAPKAIKRQKGEYGWIKYYIHDIIFFNGTSLIEKPAEDRYNFLKAVFEKLELGKSGHIELSESFDDDLYNRAMNAIAAGEEGMVLKKKNVPYHPGKKPAWSAIKIKKEDDADVICIGFEPPTKEYDGEDPTTWGFWIRTEDDMRMQGCYYGQEGYLAVTKPYYYNWCGSILIGAYDESGELKKIGSVSSGLTDELKNQMKQEPGNYIGQVCKIVMMQTFEKALRHGIFKGFRDDKPARECTLESVFNKK